VLSIGQGADRRGRSEIRNHLAICQVCGSSYDMRDLGQVMDHESNHAATMKPEHGRNSYSRWFNYGG
jgi:hypothetical protein